MQAAVVWMEPYDLQAGGVKVFLALSEAFLRTASCCRNITRIRQAGDFMLGLPR